MYRHLALYRRSWPRVVELIYWPVLQMLIWGFTTSFIVRQATGGGAALVVAGALLGGVLLWEVALRSQMGVALSFLEELWSRNLGHLFVSPIRPWEMVAALLSISMLRMLTGVLPAVLLAFVLYAFNLFGLGPVVVLFFANLMVMGWWVALGVVSLILRHGGGRGSDGVVGAVRADAVLGGVLSGLGAAGGDAAGGVRAAVQPCVRGDAGRARRHRIMGRVGLGGRVQRGLARGVRAGVRRCNSGRRGCGARC